MTELTNLDSISGEPLTETQIRGLIAQLDLDIANLVREGKLSAGKYNSPEGSVDRQASLLGLLKAREYYEKLLQERGVWIHSEYQEPDY